MKNTFIYNQSLALLTDLYQLTMIYGYWKAGLAERQAVFHIHFRRWPFQGGFAIAAGLQSAIEFLHELHFSATDLQFLKERDLFEPSFLDFLAQFSFACDIDAMPEGTLAFPQEPLLRVKGPLWQAQLLESPLLNLINFQTLIATKSARICLAAHPDPVIEFGMRRAQGFDGAISASRAAFIGGCEATSDVLAAKLFGIPVKGTHAHSWIMAFDEEKQAFQTFAQMRPKNCVMLIDTYNSLAGAKRAIQVARSIPNFELAGVRLDSGDLAKLSIEVRKILDQAGFTRTQIMASNELDEYLIRDLKQQGAKIDVWGVGTNLVTGKDQPALDGVYKLAALQNERGEWIHKLKLSEQTVKVTNPGILQVRRYKTDSSYFADAVYDELLGIEEPAILIDQQDPSRQMEGVEQFTDLLVPIFRKGKLLYQSPSMQQMQAHAKKELPLLPAVMKRFTNPQPYFVGLEKKLYEKKLSLIRHHRENIDHH
jgi:nicotinate phosphoribosyltransferase